MRLKDVLIVFTAGLVMTGLIAWFVFWQVGVNEELMSDADSTGMAWGTFVVTVDGCEYVVYHPPGGGRGGITHKGNCKNLDHMEEEE